MGSPKPMADIFDGRWFTIAGFILCIAIITLCSIAIEKMAKLRVKFANALKKTRPRVKRSQSRRHDSGLGV